MRTRSPRRLARPSETEADYLDYCRGFGDYDYETYPHERSCPCCVEAKRCNACGRPTTAATGRCTNGRCRACCIEHCAHQSK